MVTGDHESIMKERRKITDRVVISLPGTDRRAALARRPGLRDFEVFDAYDSRDGSGHPFFDEEVFRRRYGRGPFPGEVGVTISHFLVLQRFAHAEGDDEDVIVVAEDDAVPSADLDAVLHRILRHRGPLDLILLGELGTVAARRGKGVMAHGPSSSWVQFSLFSWPVGPRWAPFSFRVGHYTGMAWGAGLYAMSRVAARRFVDLVDRERADWVADDFIRWAPRAGIDVVAVTPRLATFESGTTLARGDRSHADQDEAGPRAGVPSRILEWMRHHGAILRRVVQVSGRDVGGGEFPYLDGRFG